MPLKRQGKRKMISISRARKILGISWKGKSNEEVQDLLNQLYGLAEIVADRAILLGSNKSPEVIDPDIRKEQNGNN